jgi:FAD/FMN-containing dehydrogenase
VKLQELAEIVGSNYFIDNPQVLEEYSRDLSFASRMAPVCVVKPGNLEEVQKIVRWANEGKTPLVPVSSGAPHFRGDTVPGSAGAVIVNLERMNKIIRIDYSNRVAIVEPGVTFGTLQDELKKVEMCAYLPLAPRSSKSVIGSVLEREPVLMPAHHWDSTDPLLCAEIVFGTGDKLRTGEAAGPDPLEKQWEIGKAQISPFGPTQMDAQRLVSGAQGTIGIVTWISLKCRDLSRFSRSFLIPHKNLNSLVELAYKLVRIRFTGNIFILNGLNLASLTRLSPRAIKDLGNDLPPWNLFVSCEGYGPLAEEKVSYLEADLKDLAKEYGLNLNSSLAGLNAEEVAQLLIHPSPEPYWKMRLKGGFHDTLFLTTLGKTPELAGAMSDLAREAGHSFQDFGAYIQPIVQGTSCHCEFNWYYDPQNPAETAAAQKLAQEAAARLAAMGVFFSRPYGEMAEAAYRRADNTAAIQRKIKGIFDPQGILNPGKLCF